MKFRKYIAIILLAGMMLALAGAACMGAALPYSSSRHQVNVGVITLTVPGTGAFRHPVLSPYIFFAMDYRSDAKPRGWEFVNPLAPRIATPAGTAIEKNHAAYWLVDLTSATSENLSLFDALYFCTNNDRGTIAFTRAEQDKLRRYIDGGGLLWIDNGGRMTFDDTDGLFIQGFNFIDAGGTPWIPYEQLNHPLMSIPFKLSNLEITRVGRVFPALYGINPGYDNVGGFGGMSSYNPTILLPIVTMGSQVPYIAGNEYGSGRVVATAGWVGGNISELITGGAAPAVLDQQNSNPLMASPASLKLAYNIVNWAAGYTGFRKNARHTACSLESLSPAMVEKWHFPVSPPNDIECAPATFKNCFFYVGVDNGGQAVLYALDGAPEQDWDGNGNPNDGAQDEPPGADYDIIWAAPLQAPGASSPIVFSMQHPLAPTKTADVVAVVDSNGNLQLFEALPMSGGVLSPDFSPIGGPMPVGGPGKVYAPTYHNGWLYIAGSDSQVYALNPFLGNLSDVPTDFTWQYLIHELTPPSGGMKSSPVVGIIRNKDRGADVTMVYTLAPPAPSAAGGTGTQISTNDRLYGFPVFVSGERLQLYQNQGGSAGVFNSMFGAPRATKIEENYPAPKVWAKDLNGNPIDLNPPVLNQPYMGQMTITRLDGQTIDNNLRVYATYALNYEQIGVNVVDPRVAYPLPPSEVNSTLNLPMVRTDSSLAFGANGMLYAGVFRQANGSTYPPCGSLYALMHDTGNTPKLKWAYHLHGGDPGGLYIPAGYVSGDYVIDRGDGTRMFKPSAYDVIKVGTDDVKKEIQGLKCNSSPAVTPEKVFITATSDNAAADVARGALFCFKANSDFVIRLNESLIDQTTGAKARVKIWQPDPTIAASSRSPLEDAVAVPPDMIDYNTGTISISDFSNGALRTRSGSLMNQSTNVFTPALPVWVFVNEAMVPPTHIDLSSWNNMLWFFVPKHGEQPCTGIHGSPTVMGDQVYFTCDDGYIFAIDIENSKTNGDAVDIDEKYVKWKSKVTTGGAALASSVGGANRLLGVVGGDGFHVFENPTTLIADNKRVLQVDGSSNIIWGCDSTSEMFDTPGTANDNMLRRKHPLNRPALARNFGPSDFLVVDAGNNQVIRMDKGGSISDKVSKFYVPQESEVWRYIKGNWQSNYTLLLSGESDSLRSPLDALLWVNQEKWKDPNDLQVKTVNVAHWLIADTGNFRIVDVVQRFNDNGPLFSPGNRDRLPELNWVTRTDISQKTFAFNSVQLVPLSLMEEEIWAAVGNYSGTSGQVGGSVIRIPYRGRPSTTDPFMLEYSNGHNAATVLNSINGVPVANPRYVRRITGSINHLLICDDRGVFEVVEPTGGSTDGTVVWGIVNSGPGTPYSGLVREVQHNVDGPVDRHLAVPLRAMKAQKLPNGNVLVTNSYSGWATYDLKLDGANLPGVSNDAGFRFTGEVFEVDLQANPPRIRWYAPMIHEEWVGGALKDRLQKFEQSSPLEQPMSAERILW